MGLGRCSQLGEACWDLLGSESSRARHLCSSIGAASPERPPSQSASVSFVRAPDKHAARIERL